MDRLSGAAGENLAVRVHIGTNYKVKERQSVLIKKNKKKRFQGFRCFIKERDLQDSILRDIALSHTRKAAGSLEIEKVYQWLRNCAVGYQLYSRDGQ